MLKLARILARKELLMSLRREKRINLGKISLENGVPESTLNDEFL